MKPAAIVVCLLSVLCSCNRSYYLSPFNGLQQHYKTIPLHSDSLKKAFYVGGSINTGGANNTLRDGVTAYQAGAHRTHSFGRFNAYYGTTLLLGNYKVKEYKYYTYAFRNAIDTGAINRNAGHHFFGGYNVNGGLNFVLPFHNGGEWRVVGVESSLTNEFGSYMNFRKDLPDSAATIIDRSTTIATLGIATEIIIKMRNSSIGYKMALGSSVFFNRKKLAGNELDPNFGYGYFYQSLHFTEGKWTGFQQLNIGSYAFNFQVGANYRLGK